MLDDAKKYSSQFNSLKVIQVKMLVFHELKSKYFQPLKVKIKHFLETGDLLFFSSSYYFKIIDQILPISPDCIQIKYQKFKIQILF